MIASRGVFNNRTNYLARITVFEFIEAVPEARAPLVAIGAPGRAVAARGLPLVSCRQCTAHQWHTQASPRTRWTAY